MVDPEELIRIAEELHEPRGKYLQWRAFCERMERGKHSVFATIYMETNEGTVEQRKSQVYASPQWKSYLGKVRKYEKEKIKWQISYENLKTKFDAIQSALSYQREHLKRLGG